MNKEDVRRLYDYNAWANARARDAAPAPTPEQFTPDINAASPK